MQLYRLLWIYVAVHGFASSETKSSKWPASWRTAAILIAQGPTPLLVAGGEMDVEQVEAGPRQPQYHRPIQINKSAS